IFRMGLGQENPLTALGYNNVGVTLIAQGSYEKALDSLESAARSYEASRQNVATSGLERASFGADRSPYRQLAAALIRTGRSVDGWATLEADLARGLLDEIAIRRGRGLRPDEQCRRDALHAQGSPINARILALLIRAKRTEAEAAELEDLLRQRQRLEK